MDTNDFLTELGLLYDFGARRKRKFDWRAVSNGAKLAKTTNRYV